MTVYLTDLAIKKRDLLTQVFSHYGDGEERFETRARAEMLRLYKKIGRNLNQDYELWRHLSMTLTNIIYILFFGERADDYRKAARLKVFSQALNRLLAPIYDLALTDNPDIRYYDEDIDAAVTSVSAERENTENSLYHDHKDRYTPRHPKGIVNYLLFYQENPDYKWLKEGAENITGFVLSLVAGAHTTLHPALHAAFLCLVHCRGIRTAIQREVDGVIGSENPKVEHMARMPYTQAFIMEVLRYLSHIPFTGIRRVSGDVRVDGMLIPKGSVILVNNWYINNDENVWGDPDLLRPERFIGHRGQLLPDNDPLMMASALSFGVGPRRCPVERFAKSRIFMFVTSIFQRYEIRTPEEEALVSADFSSYNPPIKTLITNVRPFKLRLKLRLDSKIIF